MTIRKALTAALCATALGGALFVLSGGPAEAATLPVSDIVGSGANAHFSPNGFEAEYLPAQCPGYHAGFGVTNLTLVPEKIEYYGGVVTIAVGTEHVFCIGGTANDYQIQYLLLGTRSILYIDVP